MRNIVCRRLRKEARKLFDSSKLKLVNPDAVKLDSLFGLNCQGTVQWTGFRRLYKDMKKEK